MKAGGHPGEEPALEVGPTTPLPSLRGLQAVERVADPVHSRLETVYFDTETLALGTRNIFLQRRSGGPGHGWYLGIPDGAAQWHVAGAPLGQPHTVPGELLARVLAYTRGEGLAPVAHLGIRRSTHRLYGTAGEHLADFIDDRVQVERTGPGVPGTAWREWRLHLVHGDNDWLAAARETLAALQPAHPWSGTGGSDAKGGAVPAGRAAVPRKPRRKGPAIDVATTYLELHINELLGADAGVRLGLPDAVHRMRSETRRLRSALSTYAGLYSANAARTLGAELKWLARALGRPRDAEVMRERLRRRIEELPDSLRTVDACEPVEREIGTAYNVDYRQLLGVLESGRYYRLLGDLERFRDNPPAGARAQLAARSEAARSVNKMAKRLERAHRAVDRSPSGGTRDAALHQARKAAKRLLHAADSVAGIHGKQARGFSRRAHKLQRVLGEHHDSVMVRAFLEELLADPGLPEDAARAYRRILETEADSARAAARKYAKSRKKLAELRLQH
ncbi:CYTH and CHAD domain-containing protein [Paeniglutamicibacter sp. R2-26]|uniref:CYTH and CHAD domain-containing protein n=1 Tax=Paeniglutamicibacter sp. R2-26 TaxID=3144417 RepID=UPI003EE48BB5